jgi:hypothetical protein
MLGSSGIALKIRQAGFRLSGVAATARENNWREADFINIYDQVNSFPLDGLGSGKRPVYVRF